MDTTRYFLLWNNILLVANFSLTLGVVALFIESAIILRTLVLTRQAPVYYTLPILPLGTSVLFFFLTLVGWQIYAELHPMVPLVLGPDYWAWLHSWPMIQANGIRAALISQLELALLIVVFALTIFLEKKLLPRINRRPLWTVVRRQRVV